MTSTSVYALASDPNVSSVVYGGGGGIFRSSDAGLTWTTLEPGIFCCNSSLGKIGIVASLAIDPSQTTTLYAGTFGPFKYQPLVASGIFKSTDGGATWVRSVTGLPESATPSIESIVVDPSRHTTVYACTDSGLIKSVDSGGTWARIALTSLRVNVLRLAGTDSSTLIAGLEQGGIYRSDDGGQIWRSSSTGLPTGIVWDLIFNPFDPSQLFVSIDGSGVFQSRDGGTSWEAFSDGLADPQITRLTFDETGSYLLAGGASLGVWSRAVPVSREPLERIPIRSEPRLVTPS